MYLPEDTEGEFEINIVPMIDVIFAILTFFIISSLFLTRAASLPVNLPQAASAEPQQSSRITVSISAAGELALNREATSLETLQADVLALADGSAVVVIYADEAVTHGRVVAVLDRLRQLDDITLGIAAQQP